MADRQEINQDGAFNQQIFKPPHIRYDNLETIRSIISKGIWFRRFHRKPLYFLKINKRKSQQNYI